jgi:hypothetical protein
MRLIETYFPPALNANLIKMPASLLSLALVDNIFPLLALAFTIYAIFSPH